MNQRYPGMGVPAPKPDNLDAMSAAYASGDLVWIAREEAAYNAQLAALGLPPLYAMLPVPDGVQDHTEPLFRRDES